MKRFLSLLTSQYACLQQILPKYFLHKDNLQNTCDNLLRRLTERSVFESIQTKIRIPRTIYERLWIRFLLSLFCQFSAQSHCARVAQSPPPEEDFLWSSKCYLKIIQILISSKAEFFKNTKWPTKMVLNYTKIKLWTNSNVQVIFGRNNNF